jgi:hypothetical protein
MMPQVPDFPETVNQRSFNISEENTRPPGGDMSGSSASDYLQVIFHIAKGA